MWGSASDGRIRSPKVSYMTADAFCATSSPTSSRSATGPTGNPHAVIVPSMSSIGVPSDSRIPASFR